MKKILPVVLLLLAGCGSSTPLFTSDGRSTTLIRCSGDDWSDCSARSDALCGAGAYDVLQRTTDAGSRSMLIACRRPAAQ